MPSLSLVPRNSICSNGTFVCTGLESNIFFLLTCCHGFLAEEDREKRKDMKPEDLMAKLKHSCKEATFEVSANTACLLTATEVLLDSEEPVLCFDQVQGHPALHYSTQPFCYMLNITGLGQSNYSNVLKI